MADVGTLQVTVSGKNIQVTPALREHAESRATRLQRYFDDERPVNVDVVMQTQKDRHKAEVTMQVGSLLVRGEGTTEDMYASIDTAIDRIGRQVRKYKTRINRKLIDGPKIGELPPLSTADAPAQEEKPRVVRVKRFAFKPMDTEEAILQMELLGHDFFVFTDSETDAVNVLYRRRDGNYGLIEPEN